MQGFAGTRSDGYVFFKNNNNHYSGSQLKHKRMISQWLRRRRVGEIFQVWRRPREQPSMKTGTQLKWVEYRIGTAL